MDSTTIMGNLLAIAIVVTGIMEWLKNTYLKPYFVAKYKDNPEVGDQQYTRVVQHLALAVSLFAVTVAHFALGQEVNPLLGTQYEFAGWFGQVVGLLVGGFLVFGGDLVIHQFYDNLQARTHEQRLKAMRIAEEISAMPRNAG